METIKDLQKDVTSLAELLMWRAMIHGPEPAVLFNKDGAFMTTLQYRGADVTMLSPEERLVYLHRLHTALKRLGTGWALLADQWHEPSTAYPISAWQNPAACFLDATRRALFESGVLFEDTQYLTLTWKPESTRKRTLYEEWFTTGTLTTQKDAHARNCESFVHAVLRFGDTLTGMPPSWQFLSPDETVTYLKNCVSWSRHAIHLPEFPRYLASQLTSTDFLPGHTPQLGKPIRDPQTGQVRLERFLRPMSIKSWPRSDPHTGEGGLGIAVPAALQGLPFPFRYTVRWIAMDKQDGEAAMRDYESKWEQLIWEGWKIVAWLFPGDAQAQATSMARAAEHVRRDDYGVGYLTPTVLVWGDTREELDAREREVCKVLQQQGLLPEPEYANATAAWHGSLPGDVYHNVRNPPLPSLALAFLLPHATVWAGPVRDEHLQGPPLFTASSDGVPFRFSLHVGELGHTLITGPSRRGKSALMGLMAMQALRYPKAQVFCFDKDYALYGATLMAGGAHYNLGSENSIALQPLGQLDQGEGEQRWAWEWVSKLLVAQGLQLTPTEGEELWTALLRLARMPREHRTLSTLYECFAVQRLKQGLKAFMVGGRYPYFDAAEDSFAFDATWTAFEMRPLLSQPGALPHALRYKFHRMDARFDGRPTFIFLDEVRSLLADPVMGLEITDWIKERGKKNVAVIMATQELFDIARTEAWQAVMANCPTKLYLANDAAMTPDVLPFYKACGLSEAEIHLITQARPKVDYFYKTEQARRMFQLHLSPLERLLVAASTPEEVRDLQALSQEELQEPLVSAWLRHNGLGLEAETYAHYYAHREEVPWHETVTA